MADHPRPSTVIVGEPTLMQPVVAQKGATNLRTTVTGREAHSSQVYQGVSAIHVAARLVTKIEDVMRELKAEGRVDEAFNVVHSSLHVGRIEGGTAINIMARQCTFEWEIRHLPSDDIEELRGRVDAYAAELEAEMQRTAPETGIVTEALNVTVPALADRDNDEVLGLCRALLGSEVEASAVAYATEPASSSARGCPPSSAVPAASARPTNRTNTSSASNWQRASAS